MSAATTEPPPGTEAAMRGASSVARRLEPWPDELRAQPRPVHEGEPPWRRVRPASPANALAEIAEKVFNQQDRATIQELENKLGQIADQRREHCDAAAFNQRLWEAEHDSELTPEQLAERSREIEQEREAIPHWTMALDRKDAELKEAMRPFALRLAVELPGRIAQAIREVEEAGGPTGPMQFWNIGQGDASIILNPLRRLGEIALAWVQSLEANDEHARDSTIRQILADAGALQPRCFVFRRY